MYHYKTFTGRSISSPLVTCFLTFQNMWEGKLMFQIQLQGVFLSYRKQWFLWRHFCLLWHWSSCIFGTLDMLFSSKQVNEPTNKLKKSCLLLWSIQWFHFFFFFFLSWNCVSFLFSENPQQESKFCDQISFHFWLLNTNIQTTANTLLWLGFSPWELFFANCYIIFRIFFFKKCCLVFVSYFMKQLC